MNPPTPPGDSPLPSRLALVPMLAIGLLLAGYGLPAVALSATHDRHGGAGLYVAMSAALACVLVLSLLPMARRSLGSRAPYAIALALGAQMLFPAFSALLKLADPLIASHWRCGTGDIAFLFASPIVAVFAGVVAMAVSVFGIKRLSPLVARGLRGLSLAVMAGVVAVTLLGASQVIRRPQAEAYLRGMPLVGELPAMTVTANMATRIDTVGGTLVWRQCTAQGCSISLRAPAAMTESGVWGQIHVAPEAMRAYLDPRADLLVLRDTENGGREVAFRLSTREAVDVTWASLAKSVAPPSNWLLCALAGIVLAALVLGRSKEAVRALLGWRAAREATLTDEGTVRFGEDLPAAKVQGDAITAAGPVLVRGDTSAAHLREMPVVPVDALRAGTLADLEGAITLADAGRYVLAATVAAWMALPLAVALLSLSR